MAVLRPVLAWVGLYAAWWLFVGEQSWQAAVWGAGLAALAAAGGVVARRAGLQGTSPERTWWRELITIPREVVTDLGVITLVLVQAAVARDRKTRGRFVHRQTGAGGERGRARRAWLSLTATYSPNAYVVDIDAVTGDALVHDLRVRRASEAPL